METLILILVYGSILLSYGFLVWIGTLNYMFRNKPIPDVVSDIYDEKEYKKWQAYTMENYRFGMITKTISTILILALFIFGVFPLFDELAEGITANLAFRTIIFMGLYWLVGFITGLFPEYYQTFVIEEKYGFNKTTKKTFIIDKVKSVLLTIVFGGGLIYLIATIYDKAGNMFFLITWGSLIVIMLIINILYVPVIVPLFNKLSPLEDGSLKNKINSFAESVGYEVSKISVMDASRRSTKMNAYFTGFGRFKKIVLYDTLVNKLEEEEIVAILAHEIGHNKHKHIIFNLIQMVIMLSVYIGTLLLVLENSIFSTAFNFSGVNLGFSIILFMVLIEPISILVNVLLSWLSRKHEYQADRYAATKYQKEPMISGLKKTAKGNFANLTPHPINVKMRYSHPPIADRITAIERI
jgi:STE24 endopeptidase